MNTILVVGLGNPGGQYSETRHNAGFIAVDKVAEEYGFPFFSEKGNALLSMNKIGGQSVILLKPQTYMNLSGEAVWPIVSFFKISPSDVIVIHDDLDLKLGTMRMKFSGGSAGHNGIKSVDSKISSKYWRIRIGIGRPEDSRIPIADFVLQKFRDEEMSSINDVASKIAKNFGRLISTEKRENFQWL